MAKVGTPQPGLCSVIFSDYANAPSISEADIEKPGSFGRRPPKMAAETVYSAHLNVTELIEPRLRDSQKTLTRAEGYQALLVWMDGCETHP